MVVNGILFGVMTPEVNTVRFCSVFSTADCMTGIVITVTHLPLWLLYIMQTTEKQLKTC